MTALLDGQHYQGQRLTGLATPGGRFSGVDFHECAFQRCAFAGATFYRCTFTGCVFDRCDLSMVQLTNSLFVEVRFKRCKLVGIDWTRAGTSQESRLMMSYHFADCVLDYSSFFGLPLRHALLARCTAREVDFAEADLTEADCTGTDFSGSKFLHTNLEGADLRGATNYGIDLNANSVRGARFSLPEAVSLLRGFDVIVE